jgi:tetratricopeptide (TPR) repeat protein
MLESRKEKQMEKKSLVRALVISGTVIGALAFTGCGDKGKHETLKAQQLTRWNLTRIGIMYQLAEQQYKVGDYDKCQDTLKEAFGTKAEFAPIYILAAKVQIEKSNLETAAEHLNHAIRINANEPEPYYLLGVLYQRWQKPEVACDYYKQAWTRKGDEARYLLAVVEMEMSLGRLDEAQATLESKLVYFEQSPALRIALARIATLKENHVLAARCYREASILLPDDMGLRRAYAEAAFFASQFAEATPILEELRKRSDTRDKSNLVMMLGQSYMGQRRYQDARNTFQEVIRERPDDMMAYLNLGKVCVQTGDLGIALSASRKILRTDPDNVQAMILMALVQQKQKKWNDAQVTLTKAQKLEPANTTVLCMLGVSAQQMGRKAEAVAYYESAVQADPKDAWAVELLGKAKPQARPVAEEESEAPSVPAANRPMTEPVG